MHSIRVSLALSVASIAASAAYGASVQPPITEAEAETFAKAMTRAIAGTEKAKLGPLVDYEQIVDRGVAGFKSDSHTHSRFRRALIAGSSGKNGFFEGIRRMIRMGASYEPLRIVERTDGLRPLMRVGGPGSASYHELVLERRGSRFVVIDIYPYASSQLLSDNYRWLATLILREPSQNWLKRLGGVDHQPLPWFSTYLECQELAQERDYRKAVDAFALLPTSVQANRTLLLDLYTTAVATGDDLLVAEAHQRIVHFHPDDPMLDLVDIDTGLICGDRGQFFAAVDRVDLRVGGDLYLDAVRARGCLKFGEAQNGVALAKSVVDDMPHLEGPKWVLRDAYFAKKDYRAAADVMRRLEAEHDLTFGDLSSICVYDEFFRSEAGVEWLRERSPKAERTRTPTTAARPTEVEAAAYVVPVPERAR